MIVSPRPCNQCQAPLTPENWPPSYQAAARYTCRTCYGERTRQRQAAARGARALPDAVALLLAEGVPMDHYGGGLQCAYCGVTTEERLAGASHRETCVWAALKQAARRAEVAGGS